MGKICWINGQPYSVTLPTGGTDNGGKNQWDKMIDFLGEDSDAVFHWSGVFSWCRNEITPLRRAVRGYSSARRWNYYHAALSTPHVGFRPVLVPLSADTLKPDSSLLTDIPDGYRFALASLYMNGEPVELFEKESFCYKKGAEIVLGDRDVNKDNWLYVIKHKDLLWADRNVLVNISWDELQRQGYTN